MVTKNSIIKYARNLGITDLGFTSVDKLSSLPTGKILEIVEHKSVSEVFPKAKSVLIVAYKIWDPIFNIVAKGPIWRKKGKVLDEQGAEFYQLYTQVIDGKAWALANHLLRNGFDSTVSRKIALKPAAVGAGLGSPGKNTLILNPEHGPFVRFSAILTEAEFEPDTPYNEDLCGECTRCIDACPTKALKSYEIDISRCLTYAVENPFSEKVDDTIRELENKLISKPTLNSFLECTICQDVCPIQKHRKI
jgi:epoxyqueuosine reductase